MWHTHLNLIMGFKQDPEGAKAHKQSGAGWSAFPDEQEAVLIWAEQISIESKLDKVARSEISCCRAWKSSG